MKVVMERVVIERVAVWVMQERIEVVTLLVSNVIETIVLMMAQHNLSAINNYSPKESPLPNSPAITHTATLSITTLSITTFIAS